MKEEEIIKKVKKFAIEVYKILGAGYNEDVYEEALALEFRKAKMDYDIELNTDNRILIVSGPNAGGKSVCLKTTGLIQYMVQCGIPVPVHPDSKVGIFQHMFVDIGDEQSIENDLSTYSSHLKNMKVILRFADEKSLILIDEFEGKPFELYELVKEQVQKRDIPGIKFGDYLEFRSKGWFAGHESAPYLNVYDDTHEVKVLAYQFGRSFHVSTRAFWRTFKMIERERNGKLDYLEEVRSACFSETINRSMRAALTQYLEKKQAPVPTSLRPQDVFYVRQSQTGQAEG